MTKEEIEKLAGLLFISWKEEMANLLSRIKFSFPVMDPFGYLPDINSLDIYSNNMHPKTKEALYDIMLKVACEYAELSEESKEVFRGKAFRLNEFIDSLKIKVGEFIAAADSPSVGDVIIPE